MARQETVLSVFVASPSDVEDERNRLEDAIRELNVNWSRELGIRLELLRWETHSYPGFAEDAQAVINSQIPNDYDIFIGIMWYRFGTPTGRAGSGTEEEFRRSKQRFDEENNSVQLMVYFKDEPAPVSPSKLDFAQLGRVAEFRNSLGKEGGLYWSFSSSEDFEKLIRLHLTRHIQNWRNQQTAPNEPRNGKLASASPSTDLSAVGADDDLGLLDLMEQFEDEFASLMEITTRIATATEEIGKKMVDRTAETNAFREGPDAANRKAATRVINKAASDMEQFVFRMEAELPLFSRHLNAGMNSMVRASVIVVDINIQGDDLEQLTANVEGIRSFREAIRETKQQISGFRDSVGNLPRLTTTLNRTKRGVINVLQRMIDEFENAERMAREAETSFDSMTPPEIAANNNSMDRSGASTAS